MHRSWWRQALVVVLFLLIASCSGGGCSSGCSSCGIEPLPAGFPSTNTIPNAASARVTQQGLAFLSANIGTLATSLLGRSGTPGVIDFDIPTDTISTSVIGISVSLTVCPNGPNATSSPPECVAEIEIGSAALTVGTATPDNLTLTGTIPIRVRDLPVSTPVGTIAIGVGSGGSCPSSGVSDANFANFPITVNLPLVADPNAPHAGYTMIDAANAAVSVTISSSDLQLCSSCGILDVLCNPILSILPGLVVGPLQTAINGEVQNLLKTDLCTKANAALDPPCPTGTNPGDGGLPTVLADGGVNGSEPTCVLNTDPTTCLPIEIGTEGHMNLGALLASISPGTSGAVDFMLAGGGAMNPANSGLTLGLLGGATPSPQSDCVPVAANPIPTGLILPNEITGNSLTAPWPTSDPGPDFGIAINNLFLNYAFGSAYNSGLLCLGITTDSEQELNTGLVSFLIPSLKTLTFEEKGAAMAITTRPQQAPIITLGDGSNLTTSPLMSILMKSFAIDFYTWSEDRYIRAFTYTADLTIPVNLTSSSAGILPAIGTLTLANAVLSNNVLITDNPTNVANALSSIIGGLVGQLIGSGFSPINPGSALASYGLGLNFPTGGIRELTNGSQTFIGLFGDLTTATAQEMPVIDTTVSLAELTVHPEGMKLNTVSPETAPSLHVMFGSPADDGAQAVEYSWRLDKGTWSEWAQGRDVTIKDPMLYMQAKHVLQVSARVVGKQASQDPTPAQLPFTIDVLPPNVTVDESDTAPSGFVIDAWDIVSPVASLTARTRGTDTTGKVGEWTEWMPLAQAQIGSGISAIDIEVQDEVGNIGKISPQLIRGRPDPTLPVTGGCAQGCTAASQSGSGWPAIVLGLAGLAALFARRRTSRAASAVLALGSIVAVASTSQGCSCGSGGGAETNNGGGSDAGKDTGASVFEPDGALVVEDAGPVCGPQCNQPCGPPLPQGLVGTYTSIAKAADSTIWVAGYNDAAVDPANGIQALYGDLVVGKYDTTVQKVAWVTVDGLPPKPSDGSCPVNDPNGWRGGDSDPGPDVGLWTSIQLDANSHPMVAYYDATNAALKFASSSDGVTWATHTVYSNTGSDIGKYAKLLVVGGKPAIAYMEVDTGTNGYSTSRVSVARANVALPAKSSDWTITDALVDNESPCRAVDCTTGQACVTSTGVCTAISGGCDAACSSTEACIEANGVATCTKITGATNISDYPDSIGDYISLAATSTGLGMVVYDRVHGNLLGLTNSGGSWTQTILDGEAGSRDAGTAVDTGDDGVGASLFVAANGDWHVSYVDGISETLKYLYIPGGTLSTTLVPQLVDNGSAVDGTAFTDGLHIVGDDSSVQANADGSISITYQDSTAGTLRTATGAQTPGTWTLHAISQPKEFAGFFPHFVPNDTTIANWWRWADQTTQVISGDVAIVPGK